MNKLELPKFQYISQGQHAPEQLEGIQKALDLGIKWIQIRWKEAPISMLQPLILEVKKYCEPYGALVCINDHPQLAKELNADAVHLGLTDSSIAHARGLLGSDILLGGTANMLGDVLRRMDEKVDYIGLGPYRFTSTKQKLSPILGLAGYQQILTSLSVQKIPIPAIFAIGGIIEEDIPELLAIGIYGIAASNLFLKKSSTLKNLINTCTI